MRLPDWQTEYDAQRRGPAQPFSAVCYAPFVSLYFDTLGNVRACCQNDEFPLGSVRESTLDEIWRGARAEQLRGALRRYRLSEGCRFCDWQIRQGTGARAHARAFDEFAAAEPLAWPVQMEFSLSNTCNLQCRMCHGQWSSLIRSRREKLPPLPKAYDEPFFRDLAKYLPHLKKAKFFGGEPLLAAESLRVLEMLIHQGLTTPTAVNTNATVWNAAVERVLDRLPVSLIVSLDGMTPATFESIRVGARFAEVWANFERFHAYCRARGTSISLTHCLMRPNVHEFADLLLLAEAWNCPLFVNTVVHPYDLSLHTLGPAELRPIVAALRARHDEVLAGVRLNREVWLTELALLEAQLRGAAPGGEPRRFELSRPAAFFGETRAVVDPQALSVQQQAMADWSGGSLWGLATDADDKVVALLGSEEEFLGIRAARCLGATLEFVGAQMQHRWGEQLTVLEESVVDGMILREVQFGDWQQPRLRVRMLVAPRRDAEGRLLGSVTWAAARQPGGS